MVLPDKNPDRKIPDDVERDSLPDSRVLDLQADATDPAAREMASGSLFEDFRVQMTRLAATIAGPDQADDAVQNAFIRAFDKIETLRETSTAAFASWLMTITRRESIRLVESTNRSPIPTEHVTDGQIAVDHLVRHGHTQNPADQIELQETIAQLQASGTVGVQALLLNAAGFKATEIAEQRGVSPITVRVSMHRGRKAARQILGGEISDESSPEETDSSHPAQND